MGKYMSAHKCIQYTWVYVSVVSLCDSKEFIVIVMSVCEWMWVFDDCIWVYLRVCEWRWVYLSVFECYECIWVLYELCNFFRNHIQNFAITAAPPFKLTRQDSGYLPGPLPKLAYEAFQTLQNQLGDEPTLAFSTSWPSLHTGHQCIYTNFNSTRRVVCDIGIKRCTHPCNSRRIKKITHPFYLRQQQHEFMWVS